MSRGTSGKRRPPRIPQFVVTPERVIRVAA
jgi:hypothetical protein